MEIEHHFIMRQIVCYENRCHPILDKYGEILRKILFIFAFLALSLTGCVSLKDPEASQEYRADIVGTIQADQTIGQTFVSRRPNLNSVQLWLRTSSNTSITSSVLTVELYHNPGDPKPLVSTTVSYDTITRNFPVTILIPRQKDPPNQGYYILLKTTSNPLQVYGRAEDAYSQGELWIKGIPQSADVAFRLGYDYDPAAMGSDMLQALGRIWLALPLFAVLWLPGRVLLNLIKDILDLENHLLFDWGERQALSIGLSLAVLPLLMLWTTELGLKWSRNGVLGVNLLLLIAWLWQSRNWFNSFRFWRDRVRNFVSTGLVAHKLSITSLVLLAVFLFSLAVRMAMIRDLAAPAWVDSVHHAIVTRLIMEHGAFPANYSPLMDSTTVSYHPGFHTTLAFFYWLSGLDILQGMLLYGQVLNALMVFATYLLTTTLTRNRVAGVIAALVTGIFTPMPAYYTSWGRYTQLAGLLILPTCFTLLTVLYPLPGQNEVKEERQFIKPHRARRTVTLVLASLSIAGLLLTHYRVAAFLACLILAFCIILACRSLFSKKGSPEVFRPVDEQLDLTEGQLARKNSSKYDEEPGVSMRRTLFFTCLCLFAGLISILLTLPWWPAAFKTLFIPHLSDITSNFVPFSDFSWSYLTTALGKPAMIVAGFGLLLAIVRRRWFSFTLILWVGLLFLLANLGMLHLPGSSFINSTSVEIMLFIPISILSGYSLSWIFELSSRILSNPWRLFYRSLITIFAIAMSLYAARVLLPILNPVTLLFRQADLPAIAWIEENIPPNETILINPFLWRYGQYAGNDGGYWITPLTDHKTLPPSALYFLGNTGDNIRQVPQTIRKIIDTRDDPIALHTILESLDIHYIYVGARGGSFSPHLILQCPLYQVLYDANGVWIFHLQP